MNTSTTPSARKPTSWSVLFLALLFIVPFGLAWYYYHGKDAREFKLINHGELIRPAKDIKNIALEDPTNETKFLGKELKGNWWIWYVSPDKCLQECHDNLYNIKQMITALGKDSERVSALFVSLPDCQVQACESYVLEHYPNMKQAHMDSKAFNTFFDGVTEKLDRERVGEIYISDPRGFVMMRYSGEINHQYILKDLKRLLKVSQIG